MWGRSRTHFPTDDIWKPGRLSWIKAGIKGFSPSPPWTGRELCTRWGKTMHLPQSWGHLAGVFPAHLLYMTENFLCIFRITSHCRWMIMLQHQQLYKEVCTQPHCQASSTSVEVLWFLQFVTSSFAINSIRDNPSISNMIKIGLGKRFGLRNSFWNYPEAFILLVKAKRKTTPVVMVSKLHYCSSRPFTFFYFTKKSDLSQGKGFIISLECMLGCKYRKRA